MYDLAVSSSDPRKFCAGFAALQRRETETEAERSDT